RSVGVLKGTGEGWVGALSPRLYQNPQNPGGTGGGGEYTQSPFPGFSAQGWNDWGAPVLDPNNNDQYTAPDHTFTCSGGGTVQKVYGYYATDAAGTVVLAEDNGLPGGRPMLNSGDAYVIAGNFFSGQLA